MATRKAASPAAKPSSRILPASAPHFSEEAVKFLRALKRNNRREWFEPRKPLFEREVKLPMLAMIEAITTAMAEFAPEHVRPAQKSMLRIYRDTRFSADKSPYKRNIAAWWTHAGLEKTSGGGFYFHVAADEVVMAAGVYMPEREQLQAIRNHLLENHEEMRRLLREKKLRKLMGSFEGAPLTRAPKGFPKEHPAMDLLLCRQWGVTTTLPVEAVMEETIVKEVITRFRLAAPLVEFLNRPLLRTLEKKRKPIFGLY